MSATVADPSADEQAPSTESLPAKLLAIAEAVSGIEKGGHNEAQDYDYVQAADVLRRIRTELFSRGILVIKSTVPGSLTHFSDTGGKSFVTTVEADYTFHDTRSGEDLVVHWHEAGADIGGEKGLYKAYTGGLKYLLLQTFLIPSGEDPETDSATEASGPEPVERPAVPVIPRDRAIAILNKAIQATLATAQEGGTPKLEAVLVAKLADVGVDTGKLGHLNVDQAEAVEAWIEQETNKTTD